MLRVRAPIWRLSPIMAIALAAASIAFVPAVAAADTATNGRLVFASNYNGSIYDDFDIYSMNPDGSDLQQLTGSDPIESAYDSQPRWSPDGTKIAFQSNRDGDFEIFVMDANGGNVVQLTDDSVGNWGPSWSPAGDRIVFAGDDPVEEHYDFDIFIVDATGTTAPVNITEPNETETLQWEELSPDWSWATNRIAFQAARYVEEPAVEFSGAYRKIVTVAADGTDERIVSTLNDDHDHMPRWSPDGTWIAFATEPQPEQGWDIQVVHPDGTGQMNLTNTYLQQELFPSWSADGTMLVFTVNTSDDLYFIYTADFRPAPPTDGAGADGARDADLATDATAPPQTRLTSIGGITSSDWQRKTTDTPPPTSPTCTKTGTSGADVIYGTAGPDVLCGLGGGDTLYGLGGNDLLIGGTGRDLLMGGGGSDQLMGDAGRDELRGGKGNDTLMGGADNDLLYGGRGTDACSEGTVVGTEAACD